MMGQTDERNRSTDQVAQVHNNVGDVCGQLLEQGWLEFRKKGNGEPTNMERVVRVLCESDSPMVRSEISETIAKETGTRPPNLGQQLNKDRNKYLYNRLVAAWHTKVGVDFPLTIAQTGSGRGAKRYLDLPGNSIAEINKKVLQVKAKLRDLRDEERDFTHLRRIDRVLKQKDRAAEAETELDKWFRKLGPTWSDFKEKRVLREADKVRDRLDGLKEKILQKPFLLIEGKSATGKTSLGRTLGYEWFQEGMPVYYFDLEKGADRKELVEDIEELDGIAIIEDIHHEPSDANFIYSQVTDLQSGHVVFTARPQWEQYVSRKQLELSAADKEVLEAFDYYEELIDFFLGKQGFEPTAEDKQKLQRVSEQSYWLLAYALRGFVKKDGEGPPSEWIGDEVRDDLDELRRKNPAFPKILVSLAPLYMNEVMTANKFLTDGNGALSFKDLDIQELHQQGEVTRVEQHGHTFYGLPHSGLAEVYWKYGLVHRNNLNLGRREDFIYEYAISEAPNGLEAVVEANSPIAKSLLDRLVKEEKLLDLVRGSRRIRTLLGLLGLIESRHRPTHIMEILADKVNKAEHFSGVGFVFVAIGMIEPQGREKFWGRLDYGKLADQMDEAEDFFSVAQVIWIIAAIDPEGADGLWEELNYGKLSDKVNKAENISAIARVVGDVSEIEPEGEDKFWEELDYGALADKVNKVKKLVALAHLIMAIAKREATRADEFWKGLDYGGLADKVNGSTDFESLAQVMGTVADIKPRNGNEFWKELDYGELADKVNDAENFSAVADVLLAIGVTEPQEREKFWEELNYAELADKVNRSKDFVPVAHVVVTIGVKESEEREKFWEELNYAELADKVNRSKDFEFVAPVIRIVSDIKPRNGNEFWKELDYGELADKVNKAENVFILATLIVAIAKKKPANADKFWNGLDYGGLADKVNGSEVFVPLGKLIVVIPKIEPTGENKFLKGLDYAELADKVNKAKKLEGVAMVIFAIGMTEPQEREKFWKVLNFRILANKFGIECIVDLRKSFIQESGMDICQWIDNDELKQEIKERGLDDEEDSKN